MKLKYVVTDQRHFAIFDTGQNHNEVARGLEGKPAGAGFCTIMAKADSVLANVHCFGESISLGISSRDEDEEIINKKISGSEY
jgi:hypothetical protein